MRHEILSVSKAKGRLLELTRKVQEDGRAYILTRDGEPVSALVPIEDYESLLETMDVLADKKTMRDLTAALADERQGRLYKRDKNGRWSKYKRTKRVA
ncbi:MAG: type II toxin-antitoxin system Phd/YefM family antitoxin [Acidobacteria bacterium]|nr:type II toxin-antitoxin system Phd/YefM family antitoxin [Acidobacteriota bacterium]